MASTRLSGPFVLVFRWTSRTGFLFIGTGMVGFFSLVEDKVERMGLGGGCEYWEAVGAGLVS
jgi:hypothetical protein